MRKMRPVGSFFQKATPTPSVERRRPYSEFPPKMKRPCCVYKVECHKNKIELNLKYFRSRDNNQRQFVHFGAIFGECATHFHLKKEHYS